MPASLPSPKDPSLIGLELTKSPQFLFRKGCISSHIPRLRCVKTSAHTLQGTQFSLLRVHPWEVREAIIWVSVPKLPLRLPVPGTLTSPAIVASWVASLDSSVSESPGIATMACPSFTGSRVLPLTVGVHVVPTMHCLSRNCLHLAHLSTPGP